ncbi:MAG: Rieske (2Fe-2S) protein [Bacteroidia bacterium]
MTKGITWKPVPELMPALLDRQKDKVHSFRMGSKKMAIAWNGSGWKAFPSRCPHSGGPLSGGWVADGAVVCPWHRFAFDLESGTCRQAGYGLILYDIKVEDGQVWIAVPNKKWWQF